VKVLAFVAWISGRLSPFGLHLFLFRRLPKLFPVMLSTVVPVPCGWFIFRPVEVAHLALGNT
jgi:hypothetical protein